MPIKLNKQTFNEFVNIKYPCNNVGMKSCFWLKLCTEVKTSVKLFEFKTQCCSSLADHFSSFSYVLRIFIFYFFSILASFKDYNKDEAGVAVRYDGIVSDRNGAIVSHEKSCQFTIIIFYSVHRLMVH